MRFMVSWSYPAERKEALVRKQQALNARKPQDTLGLKQIDALHGVGTKRGFALVEVTDPVAFAESFSEWVNLVDYEITLVLSNEDLGV